MLAVAEGAKQELKRILELKKILAANIDDPRVGLRLTLREVDQFGLSIDIEMPGDQVVEYEGSKVLLVEKELASSLEGHTLAIALEDTPNGPKLVI